MLEPFESRLSACTIQQFIEVRNHLEQLPEMPTFEQAAQRTSEIIYTAFRSSLVLVRTFITVPFGWLPRDTQTLVSDAARSHQVANLLKPDSLVLSLAGTAGSQPAWNDRKLSRRHQGIPLISSHFVLSVPMLSRLLRQMGLDVGWLDARDMELVEQNMASPLFYVPDAATTVDKVLRRVISDQDFVRMYGVKTVFGLGGSYVMQQNAMLVMVVFCSELVPKPVAELFSTLTTQLVAKTYSVVREGAIFRF
ncbi:MAG TPA: hypothetical protein VF815_12845 [Myxococcaceae bacterium]|jgi:hypothetical protein